MRLFRTRENADGGPPADPPAVSEPTVVVAVVGSLPLAARLPALLPPEWAILDARPDSIGGAELVVLTSATGSAVTAARTAAPLAGVIGLVDALTPTSVIVDILEAGADACVRSADPLVIAGHLAACYRRRLDAGHFLAS
ncbi:MAG: hypothetical protein QOJ50_471 [Cryptosporangiaceae bacterium]|jgi:hypothetical protein|nr:hypothetical protein [Cryptosporangiaceae bacterium]